MRRTDAIVSRAASSTFRLCSFGAPFENIDVDLRTPQRLHLRAGWFCKGRSCSVPTSARAVIVDHVILRSVSTIRNGPERKARPIGGGALHIAAGKPLPMALRRPPASVWV